MGKALSPYENNDSDRNLYSFGYADDVELMSEDPSKLQVFLNTSNDCIHKRYVLHFDL